MKTYPFIVIKTEHSKYAHRLRFAAPGIKRLALNAERILSGDTWSESERTKLFRLMRAAKEYSRRSAAIELFDNELYGLFGYSKGSYEETRVKELLLEGERLGFWEWIPRPEGMAKNTRKKDLRPNLIFLNHWPIEPLVDAPTETPKPIRNHVESERDAELAQFIEAEAQRYQVRLLMAHRRIFAQYVFPTFDELKSEAKELVNLGIRTKKPKKMSKKKGANIDSHGDEDEPPLYIYDESGAKTSAPNILRRIEEYELNRFLPQFTPTAVCIEGGEALKVFALRLYTATNQTARWIRERCTIEGESMVHMDFTALHPNLLAAELVERIGFSPDFLTGDSHQKIAMLLGVTRKVAKDINLKYWNRTKADWNQRLASGDKGKSDEVLFKFHQWVRENHPEVLRAIETINRTYRFSTKTHANLSQLLVFRETILMGRISKELTRQGVPHDPVHDALFVRKADFLTVQRTMDRIAKGYGILTTAAVSKTVKEGLREESGRLPR